MTLSEKQAAINRRIKNQTFGLGFWAAIDAKKAEEKKTDKK